MKRFSALLPFVLLAGSIGRADAQAVPSLDNIHNQQELDRAITMLDAKLFDAYNTCNLEKFSSLIAEDVEFYHDQGGVTLGNKALSESIRQNICGKTHRELVPESLKVYYMKGYGAVEIGVHRFTHPGQEHDTVGEAKFVHLWQYKDGAWKIARVISYDHETAK
ncbi:nuclear transport factor 2 family protein [Edaphobacter bradus]|uniref:nuclear transport factor 2 family protein n=1 Tax=Edaphobacter bradus TaxID=2259016 RepID=UPI0021DFD5CC|nr:nuclear transport factor 2 family protein [Edaphobacter bradus]